MPSIASLARELQTLLTSTAEEAARATGCVQRRSKLSGALLVQTLVLGWLANPRASLGQLTQLAATLGVRLSPQGLDQRFTAATAACLQRVLLAGIQTLVQSTPLAIPLLQRFSAIYLHDSTTIALPDALASVWPGCGGRVPQGSQAALKVHLRLELLRGGLEGLELSDGRTHDRRSQLANESLPAGSLVLEDLGYFALERLAAAAQRGWFWLTRVKSQTRVVLADGLPHSLASVVTATVGDTLELAIGLGVSAQLPCRLLAQRLPPVAAARQRRRLKRAAQREGRTPSAERLALADWTVLVTNVPANQLSLAEALALARVRWQIELLFKLWKQHGGLARSRSRQPWRVLTEVYAKLLALLIQHWLILTASWADPAHSLVKAAQVVRAHASLLARSLTCRARLRAAMRTVQTALLSAGQLNPRQHQPNTYQYLLDPSLAVLA